MTTKANFGKFFIQEDVQWGRIVISLVSLLLTLFWFGWSYALALFIGLLIGGGKLFEIEK